MNCLHTKFISWCPNPRLQNVQMSLVRWSHTRAGWTPNRIWLVFLQEGEIRTHIHVQKIIYEEEGRDWGDPINQGNAKDCHQTTRNKRRGMEQTPSLLSEEPTLRTRWYQTSSLQNYKTIHFCCLNTTLFVILCYGCPSKLRDRKHPQPDD